MDILWFLTDLAEVLAGCLGLAIAINRKKAVGYVLAAAYLIYVFSDILLIAKIGSANLWDMLLQFGPIVALAAFWMLYSEKK